MFHCWWVGTAMRAASSLFEEMLRPRSGRRRRRNCSATIRRNFLRFILAPTISRRMRSAIDYNGDTFIAFSTWKWVVAQVKTGDAPVYRYHLELAAPPSKFHPGSYAFHSDDIEYVFGTLDTRPGAVWRPGRSQVERRDDGLLDELRQDAATPTGRGCPSGRGSTRPASSSIWTATITFGPDTTQARYEFLMENPPKTEQ